MESVDETDRPTQPGIPIVDFSRWHTAPNPSVRHELAQDIVEAFREVGFVYLTNHGLSQRLVDEAFAHSKRFFKLPSCQKMLAPHPDGAAVHRGYSYPGLEKVSQYVGGDAVEGQKLREVRDCKESFEIGSEWNHEQPNLWLPEEVLPGWRQSMQGFYWQCHRLSLEILRAIALGLGIEKDGEFVEMHSGLNNQLRLLHYPPILAGEIKEGVSARMPAHSDWSSVTLLFQDDCGGLEVEDPSGRFLPATPVSGAVVVNVGDLLMRWSNDYLKSTLHRVTLPPLAYRFEGSERMTRERWSIPYFVAPDPDALVECLPACTSAENPAKYETVTQRDYCQLRAEVQYPSKPDAANA